MKRTSMLNRRQFTGALLALPSLLKAESTGVEPQRGARDVFFAADGWVGFRTSILLRREIPGRPCVLREISSDDVLLSGDRIQLRIQPNSSGSLYVLAEDQDGNCRLLDKTTAGAFQPEMMPETEWLRIDNDPGIDPVLVIFSPQPVDQLEALGKKDARLSEREMRHLIATRSADMQKREAEKARNGSIPAIFSVGRFEDRTDLLTERIEFTHRPARHQER